MVSGDLLTNSSATTAWQNCVGSGLITGTAETFDPSHLEGAGCVYRETPAAAGDQYKYTCGVSSFKYSSMTLAFHDESGDTLASETTEIFEDTQGGAYSVTLTAPEGTTIAAVGIYGLEGSGFQNCTLLLDNPAPTPVDGSITGLVWFDQDENMQRSNAENLIPATPVSLYLGDELIAQTHTDLVGAYYFGSLNLGSCYRLQFEPADPTLTFTTSGGDNDVGVDGFTAEICPADASPNITQIDAGFIRTPPVAPPEDYAVCGETYLQTGDDIEQIASVKVVLKNIATGSRHETVSSADGYYSFSNLAGGDYQLQFEGPAAFEFLSGDASLTAGSSFVDGSGMSPQFNLPGSSNTVSDDACTVRNANAGMTRTVVALDPTVAHDDEVTGFVGDALSINVLANDMPCDGQALEVDVIGHNVPGSVSYNADTGAFEISSTTTSGTYSIEYGLRGVCGSYDTAVVTVILDEVPAPPPPEAPDAPKRCLASIGKNNGDEPGVHVDLLYVDGQTFSDLASAYNFYDHDFNLVYAGQTSQAGTRSWGIFFRKREHGIEALDVKYVTAVENGVESVRTECTTQKVTPIAIDVDRSGRIDTITGNFSFDITGDGTDEQLTEWFGPAEGILIYKDFGRKASGTHLFGDTGGLYADGFAKLALEDLDNDGQISGKELDGLAVWTDRNSDALINAGEVSSVESHSIESLSVRHYKYAARATLTDGRTLMMRDVWFPLQAIKQAAR